MFTPSEQRASARKFAELQRAQKDLSRAYFLRLRELIPGAFDTPNAPTAEDVWETTENALKKLLARGREMIVMRNQVRRETDMSWPAAIAWTMASIMLLFLYALVALRLLGVLGL